MPSSLQVVKMDLNENNFFDFLVFTDRHSHFGEIQHLATNFILSQKGISFLIPLGDLKNGDFILGDCEKAIRNSIKGFPMTDDDKQLLMHYYLTAEEIADRGLEYAIELFLNEIVYIFDNSLYEWYNIR